MSLELLSLSISHVTCHMSIFQRVKKGNGMAIYINETNTSE